MKKWNLLWSWLLIGILTLSGCGGGGSSSSSPGPAPGGPASGVTTGVAVDPYILGAVFREVGAGGEILQESGPSDAQGVFVFPKALTNGSTLVMVVAGVHNGVPFTGGLKRKVDVAEGALVASPLTTLLAEGLTEDEVVAMLSAAGVTVDKADLSRDPMALAQEKPALIIAAITAGAARALTGETHENLAETLRALAPLVQQAITTERVQANASAAASTAVAVVNFIVAEVQKGSSADVATSVTEAAEKVTTEIIASVYEAADASNTPVELVTEEDGSLAPVSNTATLRSFLDKGYAALSKAAAQGTTDDLLAAVKNFNAAAALVGIDTDATQNHKDSALFFSAFSRVMALANPYSDLTDNGFNNLGDILDAFGVGDNSLRTSFGLISLPETCVDIVGTTDPMTGLPYQECTMNPLPSDAPTSGEMQQFLFAKLGSELQAAIGQFDQVSQGFRNIEWGDPADGAITEFDYADVLFLKGVAKGMLGQLHMQQAYDLDMDIAAEEAASAAGERTPVDFLADHPTLGKLKEAAKLATAKTYIGGAITDFQAVIAAIEAEKDGGASQQDDFISFYTESCGWNNAAFQWECVYDAEQAAAELALAKQDLADAKSALSGQLTLTGGQVVDIPKFFTGIDLRSKLPAFTGEMPGMFPDPTMGGVLVSGFALNQDLDGDGHPDIIDGYSRFSDAVVAQELVGKTFSTWTNGRSWNLQLNGDKTFTLNWSVWSPMFASGAETGAWSVDASGNLVLTNANPASAVFATAGVSLLEWWSQGFYTQVTLSPGGETFTSDWWPQYWH